MSLRCHDARPRLDSTSYDLVRFGGTPNHSQEDAMPAVVRQPKPTRRQARTFRANVVGDMANALHRASGNCPGGWR